MTSSSLCPCGRAAPYAACCEPLHQGVRAADTPEALMRSRYAAYAQGQVDYLVRTWHPTKRAGLDRRGLEQSATRLEWLGLTILATAGGTLVDQTGVVEFEAAYRTASTHGSLRERSRFVREDGAWYYVDGEASDTERPIAAPSRGGPCPCGSGRKFKRCCGEG